MKKIESKYIFKSEILQKIFIVFVIAILTLSNIVLAGEIDDELDYVFIYEEVLSTLSGETEEPDILSKTAVIFDRGSKEIIWGKEEDLKVPMASTTKIMTAIILLENADLNETVIVDKVAANIGGSRLGLHTDDKITLHDLLYGLMICSRK